MATCSYVKITGTRCTVRPRKGNPVCCFHKNSRARARCDFCPQFTSSAVGMCCRCQRIRTTTAVDRRVAVREGRGPRSVEQRAALGPFAVFQDVLDEMTALEIASGLGWKPPPPPKPLPAWLAGGRSLARSTSAGNICGPEDPRLR